MTLEVIAAEIEAMTGSAVSPHEATFRAILANTIDKDAYLCLPSPRAVLGAARAARAAGAAGAAGHKPPAPDGERTIRGVMPHYGIYYGPMQYVVRRRGGRFEVEVRIAVDPPPDGTPLELPDCRMKPELGPALTCSGTPYSLSGSLEACPKSGVFQTVVTRATIQALLRRWSSEIEGYYNRDAAAFHMPVTYDVEFVTIDEARAAGLRVDIEMPLAPTCGRTPYFSAMRSGWSIPILAHEVGHVMGLLDEYEALSGITPLYPKTPWTGAEVSRMGLSMREDTKILPLHHYLILRRYFCAEPGRVDPYAHVP
jgi:hypothetical protein